MKKIICGVYWIKCEINNKKYIGQSVDIFNERWPKHLRLLQKNEHHNRYLQCAWNKYGEKKFVFEILEEIKEENLNKREATLIFEHKTFLDRNCGYNLTAGGDGSVGLRHTEETKKKQSKIMKEKYSNGNHPCWGRILSNETKIKISKSNKGKKNSDEQKRNHAIKMTGEGNSMFGKERTPEWKKTHSETMKGKYSGENNPKARLTWEKVNEIREKYSTGNHTYNQLAKEFMVSDSAIAFVVQQRTWKIN